MVHWLRCLSKSSKRRLVAAALSLVVHAALFSALVLFSGGRQRDPQLPDSGMYIELTMPEQSNAAAGSAIEGEQSTDYDTNSPPAEAPVRDDEVPVEAAPAGEAAAAESAAGEAAAETEETEETEETKAAEAKTATATATETTPAAADAPPAFESISAGLDLPVPSYPAAAQRFGQQGVVRVGIHIDTSGAVTKVEIIAASGHRLLDREVVRTVEQGWRFNPQSQAVYVEREFEFRLES